MADQYVSKIKTPFGERIIKALALSNSLWTALANTFKPKQTAVPSPTASGSGIQFIDTLSQDENGVITAHKRVITDASQSVKGLMSAEDKTKLDNITSPFIPKGPATVAYLNGTISGLAVGWVYTLTDSGTLLAGSIEVEVGDEVAWDGAAWYKVGAESNTKVFEVVYDNDNSVWTWPSYTEVLNAWNSGKVPVLKRTNPSGAKTLFTMQEASTNASPNYFIFISWDRETNTTQSSEKEVVKINSDNTTDTSSSYENSNKNIATNYVDLTFPVAEGAFCEHNGLMYYCSHTGGIATREVWNDSHWTQTSVSEQIGNVESLLAAL